MASIGLTRRPQSRRIPAWVADVLLIIVLGVAILLLRDAGVLAPDLTSPLYW